MNKDIQRYDFESPQEGHELRFLNKLPQNHQPERVKKYRLSYWVVAASLSLLLASSYWFFNRTTQPEVGYETELGFKNKMEEVNFYYTHLEQERLEKIKDLPIDTAIVQEELKNMNAILEQLCQDLELMPNDDKVIAILTEHYRKRLRALDHIIKQLERIDNHNKKEHKNEAISI